MAGPKKAEERKGQILKAAEQVFAQKGFYDATVSDVARQAGVSDATIYEYFSSKEELLFTIPDETTSVGNERLQFNLNYVRGAASKIRSLIYHYLLFYQDNPDYASVIMLILKQNRKFVDTHSYQVVKEGFQYFIDVLEEGIESGEFDPDIDKYLVRATILGAIEHLVIRRTLLGKPEKLVEHADNLTDLIIGRIKKKPQTKGMNIRVILEPED